MPQNTYLRNYSTGLDLRNQSTITGVNTSDADSLVIIIYDGEYGSHSGVSYQGVAGTLLATGDYASRKKVIYHIPNCAKTSNGTVVITDPNGYSFHISVIVVTGCTLTYGAQGGYYQNFTQYSWWTVNWNGARSAGDLIFMGCQFDSDGNSVPTNYGVSVSDANNLTQATMRAAQNGGSNIVYPDGGQNYMGGATGQNSGNLRWVGAYFTSPAASRVMIFFKKWQEEWLKKNHLMDEFIRRGGVPIGAQI